MKDLTKGTYQKGDMIVVDLGYDSIGNEKNGRRPCVVLSSNSMGQNSNNVIVDILYLAMSSIAAIPIIGTVISAISRPPYILYIFTNTNTVRIITIWEYSVISSLFIILFSLICLSLS